MVLTEDGLPFGFGDLFGTYHNKPEAFGGNVTFEQIQTAGSGSGFAVGLDTSGKMYKIVDFGDPIEIDLDPTVYKVHDVAMGNNQAFILVEDMSDFV